MPLYIYTHTFIAFSFIWVISRINSQECVKGLGYFCFQSVIKLPLKVLPIYTAISNVQKYHFNHNLSSNEDCQFKCANVITIPVF